MPAALKKHLARLEVKPGDVLIFKVPMGAPAEDYRRFCDEVALQAGVPVLATQPGFEWAAMTQDQLAEFGLVRILPDIMPATTRESGKAGSFFVNWEAYEEEAHQIVRLAYQRARVRWEEQRDAQKALDELKLDAPEAPA